MTTEMISEVRGDRPAAARNRQKPGRVTWWAYLFLLVPVLTIFMLEIIPTLGVVWLSFTDYNPLSAGSWHTFIGLDNYTRLVQDDKAWQALWQTLYFVVLYLPASVVLGLVVALLLNQKIRGRVLFRGVFFLPVIASWVVGATMLLWFLDPESGGLALLMSKLGMGRPPFLLQNEATVLPTLAGVAIWKFVGYNAVLFLAGLQSVDQSLIEAAKVDGAGAFSRLRYVTLPSLRPITAVVVVLNLITSLRLFDPIKVMTNGGPNFSSSTLVMYFYQQTWDGLQFGYGSVITIVLTLLILVGSALQFLYLRYRGGPA
jgi:multiple sugar transport system permease protein